MDSRLTAARTLRVHIRSMIRRDMPEVMAIDARAFAVPWTKDEFARAHSGRNCIGMVAQCGGDSLEIGIPCGFVVYRLLHQKIEIDRLAVARVHLRHAVGSQIIAKLQGKLAPHRQTKLTISVRETNLAGQLFFRQQGFLATEVARQGFADTGEDAYRMEYKIGARQRVLDTEDNDGEQP